MKAVKRIKEVGIYRVDRYTYRRDQMMLQLLSVHQVNHENKHHKIYRGGSRLFVKGGFECARMSILHFFCKNSKSQSAIIILNSRAEGGGGGGWGSDPPPPPPPPPKSATEIYDPSTRVCTWFKRLSKIKVHAHDQLSWTG